MAFGPRLVAVLLGGWGSLAVAGARSYVLASLVGGVAGAKLFARMVGAKQYDKVCSWICAEGPRATASVRSAVASARQCAPGEKRSVTDPARKKQCE
eukprot:4208707-Prymnesium_polylepis.1